MNQVSKRIVLATVFAVFLSMWAFPAFSSDDDSQLSTESELRQAMAILDRIIADGGEDAAAHELRGDVFAARGLGMKSKLEHEIAASMSLTNEPHLLSRK